MAAKGTRVTEREKRRMWDLYQKFGSYKIVAKKMRRSRDTISKYVLEYETALKVAHIMTDEKEKSQ